MMRGGIGGGRGGSGGARRVGGGRGRLLTKGGCEIEGSCRASLFRGDTACGEGASRGRGCGRCLRGPQVGGPREGRLGGPCSGGGLRCAADVVSRGGLGGPGGLEPLWWG